MTDTMSNQGREFDNGEDRNQDQDSARFAEKAAQVKDLLAELATLAPGAASEQVSSLKKSAGWLYREGTSKAKELGSKVCDTIKRRPAETALVGVGLGLLAWWLLASRKSAVKT